MANVQYIGARYVPKFFQNPDDQSNGWKSGVLYEALMIVTYNNDSYTSKKVVPETVGNPADNPDYWACTTKYTAALMALQETVGEIEDDLDMIRPRMYYVTPQMFGSTGTDDDSATLLTMLDAVKAGDVVIIPPGTYKFSETLVIDKNIHFISYGDFYFTGSKDRPAIMFNRQNNVKIQIRAIFDSNYGTFHGWSDNDYCAIQFTNIWNCDISIGNIVNFTTGVEIRAHGGLSYGVNHNRFNFGRIQNCKIGINFIGDGPVSWINNNVFNKVYYTLSGSAFLDASAARTAILETFVNGCQFPHDSNIFNNFACDVINITAGTFRAISLSRAVNWKFNDYRTEINGGTESSFADLDLQYDAIQNLIFRPLMELRTVVENSKINVLNASGAHRPITSVYICDTGINANNFMEIHSENLAGRHKRYASDFSTVIGLNALGLANVDLADNVLATGEHTYIYGTVATEADYARLYENVLYIDVAELDTINVKIAEKTAAGSYIAFKGYDEDGHILTTNWAGILDYTFNTTNYTYMPNVNKKDVSISVLDSNVTRIAVMFFGYVNSITLSGTRRNTVTKSVKTKIAFNNDKGFAHNDPVLTDDFDFGDVLINSGTASPYKAWQLTYAGGSKTWTPIS